MPAEALGPTRHPAHSYPAHMSRVSLERSRGAVLERMGSTSFLPRGRCARAPGHRVRGRVRRIGLCLCLCLGLGFGLGLYSFGVSRVGVRVCVRVRVRARVRVRVS